jgi:hypothetical protein
MDKLFEHLMLDLETMGKGPNAAIIAIGAVLFDKDIPPEHWLQFYCEVSLESSVRGGGVIDPSTVLWWLEQAEEARSKFFNNKNANDIETALYALLSFIEKGEGLDGVKVWGNGARFDNEILANAYKRMGIQVIWDFRNDRCYRTIKAENPEILFEFYGVKHCAVDDAMAQALHLVKIWKSKENLK